MQGLTFILSVRNSMRLPGNGINPPWRLLSLVRREKRPVKLESQVQAKEKPANGTKKAFVLHVRLLLVTMAFAISLETYFLREFLLFVACAALLVFFSVDLALLGVLFHAAAQGFLQSVGQPQPKPRIAQHEEAHAERLVGSLVVPPTISAAAGRGR